MLWIRIAQLSEFTCEFHDLSNKKVVSNKSRLKTLQPFVDKDGLFGLGSLTEINTYTYKHPLVSSSKHKVTLLYTYEHASLLRGLFTHIQHHYWPLRGMALAWNTVHKCMVCSRLNLALETSGIITTWAFSRVFSKSGVDICEPIFIKSIIRRNKTKKCYVSVFICFVTWAIHLELVSDLSTKTFLVALTRFMS